MTSDKQGQPAPDVDRPGERARAFNAAMATLGIAAVVFIAPESFVRDRFEIAPIAAEEFARHPRWSDAWLDGLEAKQAYRITRVGAFE